MKFKVDKKVFDLIPNACFGVVVAKGIEEGVTFDGLNCAVKELEDRFQGKKAKELEGIIAYRDIFRTLGYNPNKFMPSIESLTSRILKGKGLPSIFPVVDLYNSISIKHLLPIGGHDIDTVTGDLELRLSKSNDTFTSFGSTEGESIPEGELVYAVGNEIKTRKWIWRQGELGKITPHSRNIFFPIDGIEDFNKESVELASKELAEKLKSLFNCEVSIGYVNQLNQEVDI